MRGLPLLIIVLLVPAVQAGALEVRALAGSFSPERIEAQPGGTVLFTNADDRAHTVTSVWDGGESLDVTLKRGQFVRVTFAQAGDYVIRCLPHSSVDEQGRAQGMVTTVHVAAPAATSPALVGAILVLALGGLYAVLVIARGGGAGWLRPRRLR